MRFPSRAIHVPGSSHHPRESKSPGSTLGPDQSVPARGSLGCGVVVRGEPLQRAPFPCRDDGLVPGRQSWDRDLQRRLGHRVRLPCGGVVGSWCDRRAGCETSGKETRVVEGLLPLSMSMLMLMWLWLWLSSLALGWRRCGRRGVWAADTKFVDHRLVAIPDAMLSPVNEERGRTARTARGE